MAESSQPPKEFVSTELTQTMAGTSSEPPKDQNPEPSQDDPATFSFSFKIRPASKLKIAMEALSDEEYTEHGMGMIQVNETLVMISNGKIVAMGYLRLNASGLIDFKYNHPFEKKEISLKKINETLGKMMNLPSFTDNETIGIHHVQGSNELCFTLGSPPAAKFSVELLEITDKNYYFDFPEVTYPCEFMVHRDHMKLILQYLDTCDAKRVVICITNRTVYFSVGGEYRWNFTYDDENQGIKGMKPGQMHTTSFEWPYSKSLKKALPLATGVIFSPTDPASSILLRINLQELGDLSYYAAALNRLNHEPQKQAQVLAIISRLTPIVEVQK